MPNRKKGKGIKKEDTEGFSTVIVPPQVSTEVSVSSQPVPFIPKNTEIHESQKMPVLKQGAAVPDEKPTGLIKPEE